MDLPDIEPFYGLSLEQYALLSFMEHWSEAMSAAGWMQDLEYALATVSDQSSRLGGASPTTFEQAYRTLVDMAGGWFTHDIPRRRFVPGNWDDLRAGVARCKASTDAL